MLSSRINSDDTDDDEEGQSTMPGDYESWSRAASRAPSRPSVSPPRPSVPRASRPSRRPPPPPPVTAPARTASKPWPPVTPATSPVRTHRRRRRPITPEIVIERQHRRHRSSGRNRIITIPLDNRPTLGLRGPPKRVLEIERVRCHRRRKRRSSCYEIDYDDPPPPTQLQSNVVYTDPHSYPYLLPAQPSIMPSTHNSSSWLASFSNLTPEIIENLPKQTVHLPPIHLPGSQADTNTELETVIFPAEIINPIDGTLSIIQSNSATNGGTSAVVQHPVAVPAQPQFISTLTNVQSPLAALATASGPFMQQVQDLFQRIALSQPQPRLSPYNPAAIQPSLPVLPQYNATNIGPYPPANIQSTITPNSRSYNTTTFTPVNLTNTAPYPSANITSYRPSFGAQYNPVNTTSYQPTSAAPYGPANITPYRPIFGTQYNPVNATSYQLASNAPYSPANITPYHSANITPYTPSNNSPYSPANITSYQPSISNFTPSNTTNIQSYRPVGAVPSDSSDIGPYRPANITPYNTGFNQSGGNSILPPSIPSTSTPYIPSSSLGSSDSFNSSSSPMINRSLSIPNSSQTPYQSNTPMPKSILRNAPSNRPLNATYTRLNPPNALSPNGVVREMVTAV